MDMAENIGSETFLNACFLCQADLVHKETRMDKYREIVDIHGHKNRKTPENAAICTTGKNLDIISIANI